MKVINRRRQGGFLFYVPNMTSEKFDEEGTHEVIIDDGAGIVKAYEAVTQYCGFSAIEAGKTMELSPYGKPNANIPPLLSREQRTGSAIRFSRFMLKFAELRLLGSVM